MGPAHRHRRRRSLPMGTRSCSSDTPRTGTISSLCRSPRRRGRTSLRQHASPRDLAGKQSSRHRSDRGRRWISAYRPLRTLAPQFWMPVVESDARRTVRRRDDRCQRRARTARLRRDRGVGGVESASRLVHRVCVRSMVADAHSPVCRTTPIHGRTVRFGLASSMPERCSGSRACDGRRPCSRAISASEDVLSCESCSLRARQRSPARRNSSGMDVRQREELRLLGQPRIAERRFASPGRTRRKRLGRTRRISAMTIDARAYAAPRSATRGAWRFARAGATAWGDKNARRLFSASGSDPPRRQFDFGRGAIGLLRGFESDTVVGQPRGGDQPGLPISASANRARLRNDSAVPAHDSRGGLC